MKPQSNVLYYIETGYREYKNLWSKVEAVKINAVEAHGRTDITRRLEWISQGERKR